MEQSNIAQKIREHLGIPSEAGQSFDNKNPSHTKKGPGRKHQQGKPEQKAAA